MKYIVMIRLKSNPVGFYKHEANSLKEARDYVKSQQYLNYFISHGIKVVEQG